ncbi:MAG: hypothetical protein HGA66_05300 [Holophaga sp.]|nr:hypothetical protein [Holophaga sp.]
MTAHLKRWLATTGVLAEPEAFRTGTLGFLRALERRLQAEDQDFYPFTSVCRKTAGPPRWPAA